MHYIVFIISPKRTPKNPLCSIFHFKCQYPTTSTIVTHARTHAPCIICAHIFDRFVYIYAQLRTAHLIYAYICTYTHAYIHTAPPACIRSSAMHPHKHTCTHPHLHACIHRHHSHASPAHSLSIHHPRIQMHTCTQVHTHTITTHRTHMHPHIRINVGSERGRHPSQNQLNDRSQTVCFHHT